MDEVIDHEHYIFREVAGKASGFCLELFTHGTSRFWYSK